MQSDGERRVMVTGAAGFIGAHVVRRFLKDGYEVVGVDNLNNYYDPRLKEARLRRLCMGPRFWFFPLDLADRVSVESLFRAGEYDAVIHLAAQAGVRHSLTHPDEYVSSNLIGFVNVLEGVRRCACRHFLFASSSSVYGAHNAVPFVEEDATDLPISLYAATKKSNEVLAHAYSHLYRVPTTGLRFFTAYGPWGRPDMAIFRFAEAILAERPIELFHHGRLRRDFTYIDDIVESLVRLLPLPPPLPAVVDGIPRAPMRLCNLGNQHPVELLHLVRVMEACLGKPAEIHFAPMQPGDAYETHARMDRLIELTGYTPRVSLEEGIERFVAWYRDDYLPLGLGKEAAEQLPPPMPVQSDVAAVELPAQQA